MRLPITCVVAVMCMLPGACGEQPPERPGDAVRQEAEPLPADGRDPWEAARRRGIDFRGLGQEPGWFLEIEHGGSMHLVYDYMERQATVPAPQPVTVERRTTYASTTGPSSLTVHVDDEPCRDIMSGHAFPATVTVIVDGRELHGCGRALQ